MRVCCMDQAYRALVEEVENRRVEECVLCGRRHYTILAPTVVVGTSLNGPAMEDSSAERVPMTNEDQHAGLQ